MGRVEPTPTPAQAPVRRRSLVRRAAAATLVILAALLLVRTPPRLAHWEYVLVGRRGNDEIHFAIHAAIGTGLNLVGIDPDLAGREWLAAAAHAETPAETSGATQGMLQAKAQSHSPSHFAAAVCAAGYGWRQLPVLEHAGLRCSSPAGTSQ
jgi:hypothetical protein